jgi:hypothetical protein
MLEKTCFKCHQTLPLSSFYKHPQMADGHLNKCKECNKLDAKKTRSTRLGYYQAYDRVRGLLSHRKEAVKARAPKYRHLQRKWDLLNPQKRSAKVKVNNAIRDGKLTRLPCEVCGVPSSHGHHDDYSKPLDVRWLCPKHHTKEHLNTNRPGGQEADLVKLAGIKPYRHLALVDMVHGQNYRHQP